MSKLLRVSKESMAMLEQLEIEMGVSKQKILDDILDQYMRNRIIQGINAAYESLQQDPQKWQEELEERALWDVNLNDGMEDL